MKNKVVTRIASCLVLASMLTACSSTLVTSNFGKRKYTGGYFANNPGKLSPVSGNKTNYDIVPTQVTVASKNASLTVADVKAEDPIVANKVVVATTEVTQLVKTKAVSKSVKTTLAVAETKAMPYYGEVTAAKESTVKSSPDAIANEMRSGGSCKNWVICLVLCFFLGTLGIHRFYMGYIWQGVVQLVTLGGCGIWTLIDFIRIITKDLKPKGGDYC